MKRIRWAWAGLSLLTCCSAAWADLASEFSGFTWVQENKVTGLTSSVNTGFPTSMFTLGPDRVDYPGMGTVPSPGFKNWAEARAFDEGALGVRIAGGNLIIQAAGGIDPQTGYWSSDHQRYFNRGDVFLTVDDAAGIRNFALLTHWARDSSGAPLTLDDTYFNAAQAFHLGGNAGAPNLEGHLVQLSGSGDVTLTGGTASYAPWQPSGMDSRSYAQDGTDLGDALLTHRETTDEGLNGVTDQTFYIDMWTIPLSSLSLDGTFTLGLHQTTSCGNDQIGMVATVPVPGAVVLGLLGMGVASWRLKRKTV